MKGAKQSIWRVSAHASLTPLVRQPQVLMAAQGLFRRSMHLAKSDQAAALTISSSNCNSCAVDSRRHKPNSIGQSVCFSGQADCLPNRYQAHIQQADTQYCTCGSSQRSCWYRFLGCSIIKAPLAPLTRGLTQPCPVRALSAFEPLQTAPQLFTSLQCAASCAGDRKQPQHRPFAAHCGCCEL